MTEQEWLTSTNPLEMLRELRCMPGHHDQLPPVLTERKMRLLTCACCRQVWDKITDHRSREAVRVGERYADDNGLESERADNCGLMHWRREPDVHSTGFDEMAHLCVTRLMHHTLIGDDLVRDHVQVALIREIAGNPFEWAHQVGTPRWMTDPTVQRLARAAYTDRPLKRCERCKGTGWISRVAKYPFDPEETLKCPNCDGARRVEDGSLDPDALGVLADAMEDADCEDETILAHLRGLEPVPTPQKGRYWRALRGPHVRGCWVLDMLLVGK